MSDSISKTQLLIVDDDQTHCYLLKERLIEEGFLVDIAYDGKYAIDKIKNKSYDLVLLDLNMQYISGIDTLHFVKDNYPKVEVLILSANSDPSKTLECIKIGAYDYVQKPYRVDELMIVISRALEHRELVIRNELLEKKKLKTSSVSIIGSSKLISRLLDLAGKAAASDSNVLITGETGTGKELLAHYVHQNSMRRDRSFVVINCASLPDQLIESELFGYEKGAFTDAKATKQGLVEIANGGTLFLDEIGEMSIMIQPKLLRFLENGEYRRIGGVNTLKSNVRVIGATNRDLYHEAEIKNFRKDLLFRLNVITLEIPPLRSRREDIIELAEFFLYKKTPIRSPKQLSPNAKTALLNYSYNGNIRELQHIIERAIIFSEGSEIEPEHLFLHLLPSELEKPQRDISELTSLIDLGDQTLTLEDVEKLYIKKVLQNNNWERGKTAVQLGISLKTLYTKILKYNLKDEQSAHS